MDVFSVLVLILLVNIQVGFVFIQSDCVCFSILSIWLMFEIKVGKCL